MLSEGVKKQQIISVALDEIDNLEYRNPFKLNEYITKKTKNKKQKYYIFIDEIQLSVAVSNPYVDSNEKNVTFVDVLLGLMKHDNLDIYVTGSNSKMLSSDVRTQFRDRGDEIHVNPLSFAGICELYKNKMLAFEHYTIYGEMPYIYSLKNDEEKNQYLKAFIKKIEVYMNAYPRKQLDGKSANEMYQERFA